MRHSLPRCALFLAVLVSVLAVAARLQAADIAWISFHATDSASTAALGATPSHTAAPDIGYTNLLTGAGHTVTRFLTADSPNAATLNGFDLVIIGRSVNSGHYELDAETAAWNGITAPMIITGGYVLRSNRLGFTTGTTIPDTAAPVNLMVNNPSHPIFAGVALGAGNMTVNPYAGIVTFSGSLQRGVSVNTNPVAGGGTILATVGTAGDPATGGMVIGEWPAGAVLGTTPPDTLGGRRLVFLTGSRESATAGTSEVAGLYDLTSDGERMFLNAVNYMAVPEPSTYVLAALGFMLLLLWRKRRAV